MAQKHALYDIQNKANLLLQMSLLLNVYLSSAWALLYGFHIFYNLTNLRDFHGIFIIIAYAIASITECGRLYAGYSGNLRAQIEDLSIFLIMTPLIQLPVLLFLFISTKSQVTLIQINICSIFVLMALECITGIFTWRKLSYHQNELYKLKREIALQMEIKNN